MADIEQQARHGRVLRQYLAHLRNRHHNQGTRPRWCEVYAALEAGIAALASQPQAPAAVVPDGWVLVRREPSRKILDDLRGLTFLLDVDDEVLSEEWALLIAEASQLAAAPAPEVSGG